MAMSLHSTTHFFRVLEIERHLSPQPEAIQEETSLFAMFASKLGCVVCAACLTPEPEVFSFSVGFLVPQALHSRIVCHSSMFIGRVINMFASSPLNRHFCWLNHHFVDQITRFVAEFPTVVISLHGPPCPERSDWSAASEPRRLKAVYLPMAHWF